MSERRSYAEKLLDPRWQKKRLKTMEYAKWRCQICGAKKSTLHCHHSYYSRGKEPWQYPDGAIICICDSCHGKIHGKPKPPPDEPPPEASAPKPPNPPPPPPAVVASRFAAMRAMLKNTR